MQKGFWKLVGWLLAPILVGMGVWVMADKLMNKTNAPHNHVDLSWNNLKGGGENEGNYDAEIVFDNDFYSS